MPVNFVIMSVNLDKKVEISALYGVYGALLTEKQCGFVEMFYNLDMSLAEIAESEDISRQAVRDALMRAVDSLYRYEEALGVYGFAGDLSQKLYTAEAGKDWETVQKIRKQLEEKYGVISRS